MTWEKSVALWSMWWAFPNSQLWNRVSNKLDCLKPGLNPDRSCLSIRLRDFHLFKHMCRGDYTGFLRLCFTVLHRPMYSSAAVFRYMRRRECFFFLFLAVGDTAKATVTFKRRLAFNTTCRVLSLLIFPLRFPVSLLHISLYAIVLQKIELTSDIHCEETDLAFEWVADPWWLSQLTMVVCEDSWTCRSVLCEGIYHKQREVSLWGKKYSHVCQMKQPPQFFQRLPKKQHVLTIPPDCRANGHCPTIRNDLMGRLWKQPFRTQGFIINWPLTTNDDML